MDTVELISEDGQSFKLPRVLFRRIGIFRAAVEDPDMHTFPIHTVTSNILARVLEYLELHADDPSSFDPTENGDEEDVYTPYTDLQSPKDRAFMGGLDLPTLIELTKAANYLHVPELLEQCCRAVAGHMRGLTTEQLRAKFNIVSDFTLEEEEQLKKTWDGL